MSLTQLRNVYMYIHMICKYHWVGHVTHPAEEYTYIYMYIYTVYTYIHVHVHVCIIG